MSFFETLFGKKSASPAGSQRERFSIASVEPARSSESDFKSVLIAMQDKLQKRDVDEKAFQEYLSAVRSAFNNWFTHASLFNYVYKSLHDIAELSGSDSTRASANGMIKDFAFYIELQDILRLSLADLVRREYEVDDVVKTICGFDVALALAGVVRMSDQSKLFDYPNTGNANHHDDFDRSKIICKGALRALTNFSSKETLVAVSHVMLSHSAWEVRQAAAQYLMRSGDSKSIEALQKLLDDRSFVDGTVSSARRQAEIALEELQKRPRKG